MINNIQNIIEVCLLTANSPISLKQLAIVFDQTIAEDELKRIVTDIGIKYKTTGLELIHLETGYRFRSQLEFQPYLNKLYQIKPPRYSRAVMETLAIIAYHQPTTRGEIEELRGVSLHSNVISTLLERGLIEVVGHKQVPGKPELFATTALFLEELGLYSLKELPQLANIDTQDNDPLQIELFANIGNNTDE